MTSLHLLLLPAFSILRLPSGCQAANHVRDTAGQPGSPMRAPSFRYRPHWSRSSC
ncbi:hypothetical protein OTERR_07170 [Oryzomicrobium terrae]|uniref:Uncharacterized protein n=1 Tax=Oryzomicrobium terrae TaxID=1735038 RepID=A0A5C1E5P6_9RHOO|nr:hypothetical protein OTERR_07170 [Oryzomicrobium terrae]